MVNSFSLHRTDIDTDVISSVIHYVLRICRRLLSPYGDMQMVQQTIRLSSRYFQTESQLHPNRQGSRGDLANKVLRPMRSRRSRVQPVPSLTLVFLTVVSFFPLLTVHSPR